MAHAQQRSGQLYIVRAQNQHPCVPSPTSGSRGSSDLGACRHYISNGTAAQPSFSQCAYNPGWLQARMKQLWHSHQHMGHSCRMDAHSLQQKWHCWTHSHVQIAPVGVLRSSCQWHRSLGAVHIHLHWEALFHFTAKFSLTTAPQIIFTAGEHAMQIIVRPTIGRHSWLIFSRGSRPTMHACARAVLQIHRASRGAHRRKAPECSRRSASGGRTPALTINSRRARKDPSNSAARSASSAPISLTRTLKPHNSSQMLRSSLPTSAWKTHPSIAFGLHLLGSRNPGVDEVASQRTA